ncbi:MAG: efflux RND transporter permease subunit [Clostridia bacterium]|nr:efflux RND transporter permease subunit [Clostridia bacterium]
MQLTELAIKRPAMMSMVIMTFIVLGLYTYSKIGVELFPNANIPVVTVSVGYSGAGAQEIETQVIKPLESALSSVSKVNTMVSSAREGMGSIMIEFDLSADPDMSLLDVQKKVDAYRGMLPKEVDNPVVMKWDMNAQPVMFLQLTSAKPLYESYEMAKDLIKERLQRVPGVADVSVVGGQKREIQINLDKAKLDGYGISISQIISRLRAENLNQPSGRLDRPEKEYNVRVLGEFSDVEEIRNLDIPLADGSTVALRDVATIIDGYEEIRNYSRLNGETGVGIMVFKQSDASVVDVAEEVRKEIDGLSRQMPGDYKLTISTDTSEFINSALNGTTNNIIEGIITVAIALYLFLREWRSMLIVILAIPTSLIATIMVIYFAGFTFNFLSMMGLAMCIGILVDDSIVVLENIHRHLKMGKSPIQAALDGRKEIGMAAIAITLSDVVVFAPIAFMDGMIGQFFRQFGLTVVFATLFSLFISFTLTPMMASRLYKQEKELMGGQRPDTGRISIAGWLKKRFEPMGKRIAQWYEDTIIWALDHRKTVLGAAFAAFVAAVALIPMGAVGAEFMTRADQNVLNVTLEMPTGTPIQNTDEGLREIEKYIKTIPEIKYYHTTLGSSGGMGGASGSHIGRIGVQLISKNDRERTVWQIGDDIRKWSKSFPYGKVSVSEQDSMGGPGGSAIQIQVKGTEPKQLVQVSEKVQEILANTPGAIDVDTDWRLGQPELQVKIDRMRTVKLGLSVDQVARTVRSSISGERAGYLRTGDEEIDMVVRMDQLNKDDVEAIKRITIPTGAGNLVQLQEVAEITVGSGPTEIRRLDRLRAITVTAGIRDRALNDISTEIQGKIDKLKLPAGFEVKLAGQTQEMQDTFQDLIAALVLSITLVYMVLVMLYESFLTPFIRMFSLPLGVVGALVALAVTGNSLNVFSMIGVIMMDGLVAKNGTLLLDYTNTLLERGYNLREALIEACKIRLRPIMMTTITMVFGMMPVAAGLTEGAETRAGMAVVLIGGLITSTAFTLVVIPVIYTIMDDLKKWLRRKWEARRQAVASVR